MAALYCPALPCPALSMPCPCPCPCPAPPRPALLCPALPLPFPSPALSCLALLMAACATLSFLPCPTNGWLRFPALPCTALPYPALPCSPTSLMSLLLFGLVTGIFLSFLKMFLGWLIDCMMFNAFFSCIFKLYLGSQCNYHCFPGVFTSSPHSILSKPLAAFPHNHCRINGQWGERGINPVRINPQKYYFGRAEGRTSDLMFSSFVRYRLRYWGSARCFRNLHSKGLHTSGPYGNC